MDLLRELELEQKIELAESSSTLDRALPKKKKRKILYTTLPIRTNVGGADPDMTLLPRKSKKIWRKGVSLSL